jgi:hypothetical protein
MKGVLNKRPPSRTLLPSWSLSIVLKFLQGFPFIPIDKSSLEAIALKTVFLVAITTARRVSELSALGRNPPYSRVERVVYEPFPDFSLRRPLRPIWVRILFCLILLIRLYVLNPYSCGM